MKQVQRWQWIAAVALATALARPATAARGPETAAATTQASATQPGPEEKPLAPAVRPAGGGVEDRSLKSAGGSGAWDWLRTILALALVVGLIFLARHLLRRFGVPVRARPAGGDVMEVLARSPVSQRQQLLLVRLGGRLVLVGAGPSGMSALCEVTDAQEVQSLLKAIEQSKGGAFADIFRRKSKEFSSKVVSSTGPGTPPPDAQVQAARNVSQDPKTLPTDKEHDK
jgi:flagellar biosynthetic protein FliO